MSVHRIFGSRALQAGALVLALVCTAVASAQTKLQTLRASIGDPILSVHNGNIVGMPLAGNLYGNKGLEVAWTGAQGATLSMQAAIAGSVDVGVGGTSAALVVAASAPNARIIRVDAANVWNIAVPDGSPIRGIEALKGRKVGVQSLSAAGYLFARGMLAAAGLDPDKDIDWVPIGVGAQVAAALRNGQVDAYGANYGITEQFARFVPGGMRFLPSAFDQLPNGFAVVASVETIRTKRAELLAFLKAYDEAVLASAANPRMAVTLHWKAFPNQVPSTGVNVAAPEVAAGITRSWTAFATVGPSGLLGVASKASLEALQEAYLKHGIIKKTVDVDQAFDLSLATEAAKAIDRAAIEKMAADWRP